MKQSFSLQWPIQGPPQQQVGWSLEIHWWSVLHGFAKALPMVWRQARSGAYSEEDANVEFIHPHGLAWSFHWPFWEDLLGACPKYCPSCKNYSSPNGRQYYLDKAITNCCQYEELQHIGLSIMHSKFNWSMHSYMECFLRFQMQLSYVITTSQVYMFWIPN